MSITGGAGTRSRIVQAVMLAVAGLVALFNGWEWSPLYDSVAQLLYQSTRGYPLATAQRMTNITPVAIAMITLLIAGIPAAVYERIRGLQTSTPVSVGIWLAATVMLALPTILLLFSTD
jgi:sugar phosphate permease